MSKSKINTDIGLYIDPDILHDPDLSWPERALLAQVRQLAKHKPCSADNEFLGRCLHLDRRSVGRILARLQGQGRVRISMASGRLITPVTPVYNTGEQKQTRNGAGICDPAAETRCDPASQACDSASHRCDPASQGCDSASQDMVLCVTPILIENKRVPEDIVNLNLNSTACKSKSTESKENQDMLNVQKQEDAAVLQRLAELGLDSMLDQCFAAAKHAMDKNLVMTKLRLWAKVDVGVTRGRTWLACFGQNPELPSTDKERGYVAELMLYCSQAFPSMPLAEAVAWVVRQPFLTSACYGLLQYWVKYGGCRVSLRPWLTIAGGGTDSGKRTEFLRQLGAPPKPGPCPGKGPESDAVAVPLRASTEQAQDSLSQLAAMSSEEWKAMLMQTSKVPMFPNQAQTQTQAQAQAQVPGIVNPSA